MQNIDAARIATSWIDTHQLALRFIGVLLVVGKRSRQKPAQKQQTEPAHLLGRLAGYCSRKRVDVTQIHPSPNPTPPPALAATRPSGSAACGGGNSWERVEQRSTTAPQPNGI